MAQDCLGTHHCLSNSGHILSCMLLLIYRICALQVQLRLHIEKVLSFVSFSNTVKEHSLDTLCHEHSLLFLLLCFTGLRAAVLHSFFSSIGRFHLRTLKGLGIVSISPHGFSLSFIEIPNFSMALHWAWYDISRIHRGRACNLLRVVGFFCV